MRLTIFTVRAPEVPGAAGSAPGFPRGPSCGHLGTAVQPLAFARLRHDLLITSLVSPVLARLNGVTV